MIVGISGQAGSGKDTVADALVSMGFCKVALADPMKRFCQEVFGFSDEQLWGPSETRNVPDRRYLHRAKGALGTLGTWGDNPPEDFPPEDLYLTPRYALQRLGTEWGRDCYRDVWIDYALRVAEKLLASDDLGYTSAEGIVKLPWPLPTEHCVMGVAISDVRFKNEMMAIRAKGGKLWRIVRAASGLEGESGSHASEREQEDIEDEFFDVVIENDGTLEELSAKIMQALTKGARG